MCFTTTDTSWTRSVAAAERNKFPTMNELTVELLRLGREFVDLRAVPEQVIHESKAIASLQERVQSIEHAQERLIIKLNIVN